MQKYRTTPKHTITPSWSYRF